LAAQFAKSAHLVVVGDQRETEAIARSRPPASEAHDPVVAKAIVTPQATERAKGIATRASRKLGRAAA
jgi:hypothetical protein